MSITIGRDPLYIHDPNAEKCRACTLKHLSTVLVYLDDTDTDPILKAAYVVGNLAHAANHFLQYDITISDEIRALRLEIIDDKFKFIKEPAEIKDALQAIITKITVWKEPEQPVIPPVYRTNSAATNTSAIPPSTKKSGCGCHKK